MKNQTPNPVRSHFPRFSILMPTFNRPQFIQQAVGAILNQDFQDFELIIKDGGTSIENLLPKDDRIIYIHGKDSGITEAINRAAAAASGDILNWSNDDDLMAPGALFIADHFFKNVPSIKWLYGLITMKNFETGEEMTFGKPWDYNELKQHNIVPQPSVFWRSDIMDEVGLFSEDQDLTSDYEFWLRLGKLYTPAFLDRIMATYRIHPGQITIARQAEQLAQAEKTKEKYA